MLSGNSASSTIGSGSRLKAITTKASTARPLVLKEEVWVRHVSTKEQHRETVMLRRQEAVITREERDSQSQ
jgi:hypothetical protein